MYNRRDIKYTVTILPSASRILVTMYMPDAPDPLMLRAYAPVTAMNLSQVAAHATDGSPLAVVARPLSLAGKNGQALTVPCFQVSGHHGRGVVATYRLTAPQLLDSHGRSHSDLPWFVNARTAFTTGRNLFLLPQSTGREGRLSVTFQLPERWRAMSPWPDARAATRTGKQGQEDLVTAFYAFGMFEEDSFKSGGTRYHVAVPAGTSLAERAGLVAAVHTAADHLRQLFARDLGADYRVIAVALPDAALECRGEHGHLGQASTLVPLTRGRLRRLVANEIDAYTRDDPAGHYGSVSGEMWLATAVRQFYSRWAGVWVDTLVAPSVERELALNYVQAIGIRHGAGLTPYADANPDVAAFTLLSLRRQLEHADPLALEEAVAAAFRSGRGSELWTRLGRGSPKTIAAFRSRYIQGRDTLPADEYFQMKLVTGTPASTRGPCLSRMRICYTAGTEGFLENCGCKSNQAGGVARRATILRRLRREAPALLVVDAGGAFARRAAFETDSELTAAEQEVYLQAMATMGYDAGTIGATEVAIGRGELERLTRHSQVPFLVANVDVGRSSIAPFRWVTRAGRPILLVGLLDRDAAIDQDPSLECAIGSLTVHDPVAALQSLLHEERPAPRALVVVTGNLSPLLVRRLVTACPRVDVVISTQARAIVTRAMGLVAHDYQGFLGNTLVLYPQFSRYGLNYATIGLNRSGRVADAAFSFEWLYDNVPDDSMIRSELNRFYMRAAHTYSPNPINDAALDEAKGYVGAGRCALCHRREFTQWSGTPHADAYKTLLERHRHYNPRCLPCHVVGFGERDGFRVGMVGDALAGVQCEMCHGPGRAHSLNPTAASIRRSVPAVVCEGCHDADHADDFKYGRDVAIVLHDRAGH